MKKSKPHAMGHAQDLLNSTKKVFVSTGELSFIVVFFDAHRISVAFEIVEAL